MQHDLAGLQVLKKALGIIHMGGKELVEEAAQEGLVYLPKERKFVSPPLQSAIIRLGKGGIERELTAQRIRSMIDATRANYRNIKRLCDTTQDPTYCFFAESILPQLERVLEEFEQGINRAKPLRIYRIDEENNVGDVLLEIKRPSDY